LQEFCNYAGNYKIRQISFLFIIKFLQSEAGMGYKKIFGYCKKCSQKVLICCPVPFDHLHLALSILTFGLWLPVWIFLSIRTCQCTQCMSRISGFSTGFSWLDPSLSKPWIDDRFGCRFKKKHKDFNSLLIKNGLVYYAATRSAL